MGPATYIIAILGCADGSSACQQVATGSARYQSEIACRAASEGVLAANSDFDFPTIVAQCRASGAQPAALGRKPRGSLRLASRRG